MTAQLIQIRAASFDSGVATDAIFKLVKKAGVTKDEVRTAFIVGRMASILITQKDLDAGDNQRTDAVEAAYIKAENAIAKAGLNSKKRATARRTKTEEQAYATARTAWSRLVKRADAKNTGKGAGNSNAKGANKKAVEKPEPAVTEPTTPVTPTAVNAQEIQDYLNGQAATMAAFMKKNAKATTVQLRNAVNDFAKAVREASVS